jgi:hypothetical protein
VQRGTHLPSPRAYMSIGICESTGESLCGTLHALAFSQG